MFEIVAFWVWVTLFTFIVLVLPAGLIALAVSIWLEHILTKSNMNSIHRVNLIKQVNKILYKPFKWLEIIDRDGDRNPMFLVIGGIVSILFNLAITANFYGGEFEVLILSGAYIEVISKFSTHLAGWTYWFIPFVAVYIAVDIIIPRLINGYLKIQSVIERSEDNV